MTSLTWLGHHFDLLPHKAMHWRDQRALIIADAHFGKAAAFREAGIPVPEATTLADLNRLDDALSITGAMRLIIVGDLLHARSGRAPHTMELLAAWRRTHLALEIILVRGNHDHHAGDPPEEWNIQSHDDPWIDGGMVFCHAPCEHEAGPVISGHIHPCITMHDVDGSIHRAPCFLFRRRPRQSLLPAFGSFTGTHPVQPIKGDRVFAIGSDEVAEIRGVARTRA